MNDTFPSSSLKAWRCSVELRRPKGSGLARGARRRAADGYLIRVPALRRAMRAALQRESEANTTDTATAATHVRIETPTSFTAPKWRAHDQVKRIPEKQRIPHK